MAPSLPAATTTVATATNTTPLPSADFSSPPSLSSKPSSVSSFSLDPSLFRSRGTPNHSIDDDSDSDSDASHVSATPPRDSPPPPRSRHILSTSRARTTTPARKPHPNPTSTTATTATATTATTIATTTELRVLRLSGVQLPLFSALAPKMAKQKAEKEKSRFDPKAEYRRRLKSLAFSRGLLSSTSSSSSPSLRPSATVLKHAGKDVVKKGHRKNRFLFSFPGFLSPLASGGKIGDLSDLATGNPILYLNFPTGRMKLFGTIVYPKNRYLTLQFARKNVLCEDSFDSLVVFSDAWWIGTEEENPQEAKLDFPRELVQEKHDLDFQGGVGGTTRKRASGDKISNEFVDPLSPVVELKCDISEDSIPDSSNLNTNKMQRTPVRQSARASRKKLSYAESSSEDEAMGESTSSDAEKSDTSQEKVVGITTSSTSDLSKKTHPSNSKFAEVEIQTSEEIKQPASTKKAEDSSSRNNSVLVQTTLSSLFEKVTEKTSKQDSDEQLLQKGSNAKRQRGNKKPSPSSRQKSVLTKEGRGRKKSGTKTIKSSEIEEEEDDIEDVSSDSEDMDESDEDWTG